jgi:single-strand DNA-binding protein
MVNFNRVLLVGNLTRDPELRYTPQGTAVATLRMAVNTPFKDKAGQFQKETCFINVVVWAQAAESCNQYLQKGSSVFVEGRLMSRSWKDNEDKTRSVIEVRAVKVQFMPKSAPQDGKSADLGEEPQEPISLEATDPGEIL